MTNPAVTAIAEKLKTQVAQERSGVTDRMPVANVLDASDVQAKLAPEGKHLRWLNLKNPNKMTLRQREGYTRLPEAEGGRVLADEMALFVVPTAVHERAVQEQKDENARRLVSHKTEMQQLAEGTARVLRDKYGIKVDPARLFSDEGE